MGIPFWLTRGALPLIAALGAAPVFSAPANAQDSPPASGPSPGTRPAAAASLASEWWLNALSAQPAWASAPAEGAGVTVAVLSTGVSPAQQDLTGNVTSGPDYTGSGQDQGGPFWGAEGTALASLIAGHGHGPGGAQGVTGIAPKARILSVRVTLDRNDPMLAETGAAQRLPDAIARGIGYAVSHGAKVIDLPLGPPAPGSPGSQGSSASPGPSGSTGAGAAGGLGAEQAAVRDAIARGVVLVAPAGDTGTPGSSYPAAYPGVVAVGATGSGGKLASFSSTGSYVRLTAPGEDITAAGPGGGYATLSSTDASAALTAGIAALVRSRYPQLSAAEVARALKSSASPVAGQQPGTGAGAVNAASTVTTAASIFSLSGNPMPNPAPAWQNYEANAHARTNPGALSTRSLTEAGLGAGIILVAAVLIIVAIVRRRRRRTDDPVAWGWNPAELPDPSAPQEPPAAQPGKRVSATDALTRATGVRPPRRY